MNPMEKLEEKQGKNTVEGRNGADYNDCNQLFLLLQSGAHGAYGHDFCPNETGAGETEENNDKNRQ